MLKIGLGLMKQKNKKAISLYQEWNELPNSPVLTTSKPYQFIHSNYSSFGPTLFVSSSKICRNGGLTNLIASSGMLSEYHLSGDTWVLYDDATYAYNTNSNNVAQSNSDIYTDSSLTTVYIPKTT